MNKIDISVIIPVYNGAKWVEKCFESILNQNFSGSVEIVVWNDHSSDGSEKLIENYREKLKDHDWHLIIGSDDLSVSAEGCGVAKNKACAIARGVYFAFQDIDDEMMPSRLKEQFESALELGPAYIIGSKILREPEDSTVRYTRWLNNLPLNLLEKRLLTSHGPSIAMPTWFLHRDVFERIGGFSDKGRGYPEDHEFILRHVFEFGGKLYRVNTVLLLYRFHEGCQTIEDYEKSIWRVRLSFLEKYILPQWSTFSIWSTGKQGRKLFRDLSSDLQERVESFCEVDPKKIGKNYEYQETNKRPKPLYPIVHFSKVKPPVVISVKTGLPNNQRLNEPGLEDNIALLNMTEGEDYIHFG